MKGKVDYKKQIMLSLGSMPCPSSSLLEFCYFYLSPIQTAVIQFLVCLTEPSEPVSRENLTFRKFL